MFTPRKGQWVLFDLDEGAAKLAARSGAWRARNNQFVGVHSGDSRTVEGVVVKPSRVVLVDESGANVPVVAGWAVHEMWVLKEADGEAAGAYQEVGCVGVARGLQPVDSREDVPPGRRPDFDPGDLHASVGERL